MTFDDAHNLVDDSLISIRKVRKESHLPEALLTMGLMFRLFDDQDHAELALEEADSIAKRCGLRSYEAECAVQRAILKFEFGDPECTKAIESADKLVRETGYNRRSEAVTELQRLDSGQQES